MRNTLLAIGTSAGIALLASGQAATARDECWSCWAGASILLGGIHPSTAGYASGHLPGIYSPYYGYAPGYYGYPRPHAHDPALIVRRGGYRSVRHAGKVQFVPSAAYDPARNKR